MTKVQEPVIRPNLQGDDEEDPVPTRHSKKKKNEEPMLLYSRPEITWKEEASSIFWLALPSVLTNMLTSSMAVVDLLLVGHLGTESLAAAALATTYFSFFFSFMIGVSFAMESLGSQAYGARDYYSLNKIFRQGFVVVTMFLILFSVCLGVAGPLARHVLLQSEHISTMVGEFDLLLIPGLWSFSYYQILTKYLQVQNIMKPPLYINLVGNLMNAAAGYGLIYYFDLGIHGAPFATTISRTTMFALIYLFIIYLHRNATSQPPTDEQRRRHRRFLEQQRIQSLSPPNPPTDSANPNSSSSSSSSSRSQDPEKVLLLSEDEVEDSDVDEDGKSTDDADEVEEMENPEKLFIFSMYYLKQTLEFGGLWKLIKMGLAGGVMTSVEAASFQVTTFEAGYLSTTSLAAHQICLTATTFTFTSFPLGLSIAGGIRIGNLLGANRPTQAKKASRIIVVMGGVLMLLIIAAYAGLGDLLGRAFSEDPDVINRVESLIWIICIFQLSDGIQANCAAVLRGLARLEMIVKINLLGLWILGVPIGAVLAFVFDLGVSGLWWGFVSGLSVSNLISFYLLAQINWEEESIKAIQNLRNSSRPSSFTDTPPTPSTFITNLTVDEHSNPSLTKDSPSLKKKRERQTDSVGSV